MQGDRDPRWWVRPTSIAVGAVGLLIFVAAVMPKVFAFRRGSGRAETVLPDTPLLADYLLIVLAVLFVVAAVMIRIFAQKGAAAGPPKRRPVWAQIATFLIVLFLVASISSLLEERGILDRPEPSATSEAGGGSDSAPTRSRSLGFLLTGVLLLLVAGLVAVIALLGRGDGASGGRPLDEVLAEELDVGLAELEHARDPRDAVIACYVRMERALIEAGVPRRRSDTPFEFIDRALQQAAVPRAAARRLTSLFERARFSAHPTTEEERYEARATLETVRSELRGVPWPA
ncbi:MAG: DUF4129 domain-containing protein [Actinomycetota bacterium]